MRNQQTVTGEKTKQLRVLDSLSGDNDSVYNTLTEELSTACNYSSKR